MKKNAAVQLPSTHSVSSFRFSTLKKRYSWLSLFVVLAFILNSITFPQHVLAAGDDFTITTSVDKTEVLAGENFTYTISYANSNTDATNAIVTDVLPSNVVYVSSEGSIQVSSIDKTGAPGNETVVFHFANPLPSGSTGILKVTVKFPEGTTIGGAANTATNSAVISSDPIDDKIPKTSNTVTVLPKVNPPDWSMTKTKIIPVVTPAVGQPVTYQITVRGNSVIGGLNMENVVITDTIPPNATYVSSSDGGVYDSGTGTITFPATTLGVGQTITRQVVLIYNDPVSTADFATNLASMTGTPFGSDTPVSLAPVSVTHGFAAANFAVADFSKYARQDNDRYSIGQEAIFNLGNIANTGNVPMDSFVVVDSIPDIITLNSITAGSYNQAANVAISYQTNFNSSYREWTSLTSPSNQTLPVADLSLESGEWVTQVRWVITGSTSTDGIVPGFSIQSPLTLKATVVNTASPDITNNATLTAYRGSDTPIVKSASKTIYIIGQMPWLVPEKTVHPAGSTTYTSTTSVNMKGTLYFRLRIQNHPYATGNYIDPVAVDVLPDTLENITYTGYALSSGSVAISAPAISPISGNRWVFNFTGVLTPGDYVDVFYTATVKDLTTAGLYENELYISTLDNATLYQNDNSEQLTDTADWDSDGNVTDRFVRSSIDYFVNFSGSLTSKKLMKGSQDADWVTTGSTLPGGIANYQITIENSGSNGPISNIIAIDQLPGIGDKTVLGGASRLSQWRPYLVDEITYKIYDTDGVTEIFPAGAEIHVYYSTSSVVSTYELSNPISGVPDASWSLTPPADITTVRAIKFAFTGFGLEKNQKIVVEWPMRAPYDAPYDLIAYNSFAYGATYPGYVNNVLVDTPFLPAEPNKVDFYVHDPAGHTYNIGNFVWEDTNKNGIQDTGENGLNGILVNLYDSSNNLVSYTRTGDSQGSLPGYYLFPNVPAATGYYLEFVYPQNYQVTDYQTGGGANASSDSDIMAASRTEVTDLDILKYSVLTAPFNLSADNLGIDAGFYQYASLGDKVWNDRDADGIQDAGEPGISGITVELLNGSGTPIASTVTDSSGLYSFTTLDPGTYYVRFTNPSGNYKFSLPGIGSDRTIDSNGTAAGDELTATSGPVVLTTGQVDLTVDQGMYLGRIGNFVFLDRNADGIQNAGETGIAGATIRLYTSGGVLVATSATTTTANPNYLFDNLNPGVYYITVQPPAGAVVTVMDFGANDAIDSDISRTTLRSADFTLARGERNLTMDVGLYTLASLGNLVWYDGNGDGLFNGTEQGLAGISVIVLNPDGSTAFYDDGTPITAKTTSASGAYSFTGLRPGNYVVKFDLPSAQYIFSPQNVGGAGTNNNSDPNITTGISNTLTLTSGSANNTIDAGMHMGMIGDYVWQDMNANGIQNTGEPGIGGVTVDLYKVGTAGIFATTTTNSSGYYSFTQLESGEYYLQFTSNNSIWFAAPQTAAGSTTANDSNIDTSGLTAHITLLSGDINLSMDAGYYQKASVGDRIWNDVDGDGIQDAGESGIKDVKVTLTYPDSSTTYVTTDVNGNYLFSNLIPGNYTVSIDPATLPSNYQQTFEKDGTLNGSVAVVLTSGSAAADVDFGYYVKSSIGNFVWLDTDADGIQDSGEPGMAGVTVTLYNAAGTIVAVRTTDANGYYVFSDLLVGTYTVGITVPSDTFISPYQAGADRALDSDVNVGTGRSANIAVLGGQTITDIDAGLYQKASVGDRIWNDVDADGVQDAGEAGIPNVTVTLTLPDLSTINTTTDANGLYLFDNLVPGNYTVSIEQATLPLNYQQTSEKDGSLDGSVAVVLSSGIDVVDVDFGYYVKSSIGDLVWEDTDADGIQDSGEPGLPGVTVTLYDAGGNIAATTTTDANGNYVFPDLLVGTYTVGITTPSGMFISPYQAGANSALDSDVNVVTGLSADIAAQGGQYITNIDAGLYRMASVGDRIWNDVNGNGVQDAGEAGIPNAKVTLTYPDSSTASVMTDASGNYLFSDLIPGNYAVSIDPTTLPSNTQHTYEKDGTPDGSVAVVLTSGSDVADVDFGYYVKSSIGDFVWQDTNANGIQDIGEPGLAGVTVTLYNAAGTAIATTVTDANGNYVFSGILVGTYTVGVTVQAGWVISLNQAGADRSVDSDIQSGTGISAGIAVLGGQTITDIDAGLYQLAQIGDAVWYDLNGNGIQDEINSGAESITVDLLDALGNVVATTVTDVSGSYLFTNLVPGQYQIKFTAPANYAFTVRDASSSNDSNDSDPASSTGLVSLITVVSGESNTSVDAGLTRAGIEISKKLITSLYDPDLPLLEDGSAMQGNDVTYVFQVINTGTTYLKNIVITDIDLGITREDMTLISGTEPLAPGASMYFYYTTKIDGDLLNTAAAEGTPCSPDGTVLSEISNPSDDDTAQVRALASVGDRVWNDLNANGLEDSGEPGTANVKVTLTLEDHSTLVAYTDADGKYVFSNLIPGTYSVAIDESTLPGNARQSFEQDGTYNGVVYVVLHDGSIVTNIDFGYYIPASVGDRIWDDTNGDGVQDPGEPGMPDVKVTLTLPDGTTIVKITDANGNYQFTDLIPGTYTIRVDTTTLPANSHPSYEADGSTNGSVTVTLISNDQITNVDFGYYVGASVGDYVWIDTNRDGIHQDTEKGLADVTVKLYSSGILVGETKTDASGHYMFSDLNPGKYYVTFIKPSSYLFSPASKGSDTLKDSNPNPEGQTEEFTLISGSWNESIDAGLYHVSTVSGKFVDKEGNPVPGVLIVITDPSGAVIGSTTSDEKGEFIIRDIPSYQDYTITATKPGYASQVISASRSDTDITIGSLTLVANTVRTGETSTSATIGGIFLFVSAFALGVVLKKRKISGERMI